MSKLFDKLREQGKLHQPLQDDPNKQLELAAAAMKQGWKFHHYLALQKELQFAQSWTHAGEIVYQLSHSLAALFAMTSAPDIDEVTCLGCLVRLAEEDR
jgi:hypothetical protein